MKIIKRVADLERRSDDTSAVLPICRYEDETDADAIAYHEAQHGTSGRDRLRVIISKPGRRPGSSASENLSWHQGGGWE